MILASFFPPRRRFLRSRLLLSTALIGAAVLMLPGGVRAQEFADENSVYFDNTERGDSGDDVVLEPESGEWSSFWWKFDKYDVWRKKNDDGSWDRADNISDDHYGILTEGVDGASVEIDLIDGVKTVRGLRMESGKYTISGEALSGIGTPENYLVLDNHSGDSDSDFVIESAIRGDVKIDGTGEGTGAVVYAGDTSADQSRLRRIDVRENALFKVTGRLNGQVVNAGHTVFENSAGAAGKAVLGGTFYNGGKEGNVGGTLDIVGRAQINVLHNNLDGIVNIVKAGDHLTSGTDGQPVGINNLGTVNLAGTIKSPDFLNSATGTLNLSTDSDPETNPDATGPTVEGRLLNFGTISVDEGQSVTLTVNEYENSAEDSGNGFFVNGGTGKFALADNSDLTINASNFRFQAASDVTVGHNLTLNGKINNFGKLTYSTSEGQEATIKGRLVNRISGEMYVESTVNANDSDIVNIGDLNVRAYIYDVATVTNKSALIVSESGSMQVNSRFYNSEDGNVEVASGGVISAGRIVNQGEMTVNVDGEIKAEGAFVQNTNRHLNINGGLIDAANVRNSGVVNINVTDAVSGKLSGGTIRNENVINVEGELVAWDALANAQYSLIDVNGGVVNAQTLNNSGRVRINVTENGTGIVTGEQITNRNVIEVYGDLKSEKSLNNIGGAKIDVFDGGRILAEELINKLDAEINVKAGAELHAKHLDNEGALTIDVTDGVAGTVTGAEVTNSNIIDVYGKLTPRLTLTNAGDGQIKVHGGGLVTTRVIENDADLDIDVGATVTAEAMLRNLASGKVNVDGGSLKSEKLRNNGELNININSAAAEPLAFGTVEVAHTVFNLGSGQERGVINVNGTSIKAAKFANTGDLNVKVTDGHRGTVTATESFTNNAGGRVKLNGTTLTVTDDTGTLGAIYNSGQFNIRANGEDVGRISAATIRNSGTLNVDGGLIRAAAIKNSGRLAIRRVETDDNNTYKTGKVTATSSFNNVDQGIVNVRGGTLTVDDGGTLGTLTNAGKINILTTADGDLGVVKVDKVENEGEIVVDGRLNAVTSFSNDDGGIVRLNGDFLKTETFNNNMGSRLVLDGGKLFVMNADNKLQNLTNSGHIRVNGVDDQIRAESLTNDGGIINVNVEGSLSGISQIVNEAGTIFVKGVLDAGTTFQNSGEVVGDEYAANVKLRGGRLKAGNLINDGSLSGTGILQGALGNTGEIDLTNATLKAPTVNNLAGGNLSLTGFAKGMGGGNVRISNEGVMNLDANVRGNVANANKLTAAGLISGLLTNTGTMNVAQGKNLELTNGSERAKNFGTMRVQGRLTTENLLVNRRLATLSVLQGGEINGRVLNRGDLNLNANSTVNGTVKNHGELNGAGTITGALRQEANGTLNVTRSLTVGSLTTSGTTNLSGKLTASDVVTNLDGGEMNLDGATIDLLPNGQRAADSDNLLLNDGTVDVVSDSKIRGGLTNNKLINMTTDGIEALLKVTGQFINNGEIRVDGKDSFLTIKADRIVVLDSSVIETRFVRLIGNLVNSTRSIFDRDRTLEGDLLNGSAGTVQITAKIDGNRNNIENEGVIRVGAAGSVTDVQHLLNTGTGKLRIAEDGLVSADDVVNEAGGSMTIAGELEATSETGFVNSGDVGLSGTLTGNLINSGGSITLTGGTIRGNVLNEATDTRDGLLRGTVTINGDLRNNSDARLAGSIRNVRNAGDLKTVGDLSVNRLSNNGTVNIQTDHRLDSNHDVANAGLVLVAGTLGAGVDNQQTGVLEMHGGTVEGNVNNAGTLRGRGTIAGQLFQRNDATLDVTGRLSTDGLINRGSVLVTADNTLSSSSLADNKGEIEINGTFAGDIQNTGDYTLNGRHNGSLISMGNSVVNGVITGNLIYQGSGRGSAINISNTAEILGTFDLARNYVIGEGETVKAGTTVVRSRPGDDDTLQGYILDLAGTVDGDLVNRGIVEAGADAVITGDLTNNGLVTLSENKKVGDKLTVGGGLAGSGIYALDINLSEMTSDSIEIQGGPATGNYEIALNYLGGAGVSEIGRSTTLIDVASEYGAKNDFTYKVLNPRTIADEKVVYLVGRDPDTGDVEMASSANPNVGAIFGNVALTRSLIGAVVNRPTSPFVTGLAFDAADKPCGVGSWGRATGGTATVTGGTDNGSITVDSSVSATYYGMQAGTDFACFDNRFAGWSMSFGGFVGVNQGDTTQLFYGIDSGTGEVIPDRATSVNKTEFDQLYAGVYVTGTKGPFQVDLQYRHENTDFSATSIGLVSGAGLDLKDGEFSSKGNTLSGSLSYTHQIGDKGWTLIPSVGFAHTRSETDAITFNDGSQLEFEDSETTIGFVSATIAKSFVQTESNSALYAFTTGTIYKDFANPSVSILSDPTDDQSIPQRLTTDNLGTYGEISFGANYVKVLQPGPGLRPRQLSASARIDARSGGDLESVGVTGQIRLQF